MNNQILKNKIYDILNDFVKAINEKNTNELKEKFSVDQYIFDEIIKNLNEYFGEQLPIQISPLEKFSEINDGERPNIDIFEMNEPQTWGIECVIWRNGEPQEAILHVEVFGEIDDLEFRYKYIGS